MTSYATGTTPNRAIVHEIGRESTQLSSDGGKLRRTRRVRIVEKWTTAAKSMQANAELQSDSTARTNQIVFATTMPRLMTERQHASESSAYNGSQFANQTIPVITGSDER